ncbi:Integrase, catalytic region, partial [sediment metagenome]
MRIAEELELAVSTVGLWLRRLGLGRLRKLEPNPVVVRYEKKRPGELLHLDTKKLGRIQGIGHRIHGDRRTRKRGIGWEILHVCVDDATRVAYAEVLPD